MFCNPLNIPNIPIRLRSKIRLLHQKIGAKKFFSELVKLDPLSKNFIKPTDTQRVIRAYEVKLFTRRSIYDWFKSTRSDYEKDDFFKILSSLKGKSFCIDSKSCSVINEKLISSKFLIKKRVDPINYLKSIKNRIEIKNMVETHIKDGVAVTKFLYWIKNSNIKKLDEMILNGSKEIVLSGINIGDFGIIDGKRKESFFDLLKKIEQIKQKIRIRISSIEPNLLTKDIINFINDSNKRTSIALETIEIYAPLAQRLGMKEWQDELEDISFEVINPELLYSEITKFL